MVKHIKPLLLPYGGLVTGLIGWWVGTAMLSHDNPIFYNFSPMSTFGALTSLVGNPDLVIHVWASIKRVVVGLAWATALGVPLGLLLGFSQPAERLFTVLFQFLRMTSPISWMPIAVMVLGVGDPPVYFLIVMASIWPIVFSAAVAVESLDWRLLQVAESLGSTHGETARKVLLPAIIPQILTGIRLALGLAWIVLVPAEMLGVRSGLGYMVLMARDRLAYPEVMALILVIGAIGFALDLFLRGVRTRHTHHFYY